MPVLTSSIKEYKTVLMLSKNKTKNLILKFLRICSCHCLYYRIFFICHPSQTPKKIKKSSCNNLRARFEHAAINDYPSQPTGAYSILLSAVVLAIILNNVKEKYL